MNILVTNDDGIDSPGIWALAEAMSRVGETLIVAPDRQQSGTGTSVSLHSSISVVEVTPHIEGVSAYAVGGTPSDCVMIGLRQLTKVHIGLVVSGINLGANVGNDIPYSGTVMATLQGYFRKIPSIAISLAINEPGEELRFDVASRVAEYLALSVKSGKMPTGAILNTNVPNIPLEQIRGIANTRAASGGYVKLAAVQHSSSLSYSKGIHKATRLEIQEGTDIWAINTGLISITPLRLDITDHDLLPTLTEHVLALESELLKTTPDSADY